MTLPDRRAGGPGQDAEAVLAQALRAMAGGRKGEQPLPGAGPRRRARLSAVQVLLIAALIGIVVGMAAGFLTLLLR